MDKSLLFKLSKMLLRLSEVNTDKGVLYCDDQMEVGKEVFIMENSEYVPAPDGDYESETQIISVVDGKISEIKDKEMPEVQPEEVVVEVKEEEVEEPIAEEPSELEVLRAKVSEYEAAIEEMRKKIAERDEKIAELEKMLAEKEELASQVPAFKEVKNEETKPKSLAELVKETYK